MLKKSTYFAELKKGNDLRFAGVNPKINSSLVLDNNVVSSPVNAQPTEKPLSELLIACFNVNRLIPHFNLVVSEILNHSYDIVAIVETFLDKDILDSAIKIQGYDLLRCDRDRKLGGGVLIYIKSK